MHKLLNAVLAGLLLGAAHGAMAEPIEPKDYKTYHSLGCMILKECTDGVKQIKNLEDIRGVIPDATYDWREGEIESILFA